MLCYKNRIYHMEFDVENVSDHRPGKSDGCAYFTTDMLR